MQITWSYHASERSETRGISEQEILTVIRNPDCESVDTTTDIVSYSKENIKVI